MIVQHKFPGNSTVGVLIFTGLTREGVAGLTAGILILVMVIVGVVVGVVCWRRQTYTRYEVDRDNAKSECMFHQILTTSNSLFHALHSVYRITGQP